MHTNKLMCYLFALLLGVIADTSIATQWPISPGLINDEQLSLRQLLSLNSNEFNGFGSSSSGGQLTITGTGNIHYLQAFFYSNTACSTLLGQASVIDNGAGFQFSNGQTVSLNPSSTYKLEL